MCSDELSAAEALTAAGGVTFAQVMVEAPAPSAAGSCAIPCGTIEIALGAAWCPSVPEPMLRR
jgi:hypothetical protein